MSSRRKSPERVAAAEEAAERTISDMSMTSAAAAPPASTANVRLVLVDDEHQPRYLLRAADLEAAMLALAAEAGLEADDMPGLHGLCVAAVRSAERHGR